LKIDENQITFGVIDFQPHPPTLTPVFASLDQEMDLTIGSFNFCVRYLGSTRLLGPKKPGPSAGKITIVATPGISVGSSSKVNSSVSFKLKKESTVEELGESMENLDLEESSGSTDIVSSKKFDNISEKDFITSCGDVSRNSEDMWRSGLKLHNNEQTKLYSNAIQCTKNQHQMCMVISDTSEEVDNKNNPVISSHNLERGANYRADAETESAVAGREKVYLSGEEWRMIKEVVNHGATILTDSRMEVLMGYQYALHQQKKKLL
jgi:hypothetical protein